MPYEGFGVFIQVLTGFDLRVVDGTSIGVLPMLWDMYDPMFQVLWEHGHQVELIDAARAIGLPSTGLLTETAAAATWVIDQEHVANHVTAKAWLISEVVRQVAWTGLLRWVTPEGGDHAVPMPRLKTLGQVAAEPPAPRVGGASDPRGSLQWAKDKSRPIIQLRPLPFGSPAEE